MEAKEEMTHSTTPKVPAQPGFEPLSSDPAEPFQERRQAHLGCVIVAVFLIAAIVGGATYYTKQRAASPATGSPGPGAARAVPVTVAKAARGDVPIEIRVVGNVLPYQTVAVTSQVTGQIQNVFFKQGEYVRKDQPLFQIDPRPLQAALDQVRATVARDRAQINQARLTVAKDAALVRQAESNLRRDQAQLQYLQAEDRRYHDLLRQGFVTTEQAEQQHANARSMADTVQADHANVSSVRASLEADAASVKILQANLEADMANERNATVQLGFTSINAPLEGRTGSLNLYPGAIVQANSNAPLITIDRIKPVYVTFAVPEQRLADIHRLQEISPIHVRAVLADQTRTDEASTQAVESGRVSFIDNAVDTTTGTINLRATFPNALRRLWPGHYVNVTVMLGEERNVVTVPEQAVQPGQDGDYLFAVKPDNTVEARTVNVDRSVGGVAIVRAGLEAGETVVTDGQLLLVPGATVRIREENRSAGDASGRRRGFHLGGSPGPSSSAAPLPDGRRKHRL